MMEIRGRTAMVADDWAKQTHHENLTMTHTIFQSSVNSLKLLHRGKVHEVYEVNSQLLLIVATDRLPVFEAVLPTPVPDKGKLLTELSRFWFGRLEHIVPNHLTGIPPEIMVAPREYEQIWRRAVVVKKLVPLPVKAVVHGYLAGAGWKEYRKHHSVCGIPLSAGLLEADKLYHPLFTLSRKAKEGAPHDENIGFATAEELLGKELAAQVRAISIALYTEAGTYARSRGIIIVEAGFEFGLDERGELHLIGEALTPDSSSFWLLDQYRPGHAPPSFDKQHVHDWLKYRGWNKRFPEPELPPAVAAKTSEKYREMLVRLTGRSGG